MAIFVPPAKLIMPDIECNHDEEDLEGYRFLSSQWNEANVMEIMTFDPYTE